MQCCVLYYNIKKNNEKNAYYVFSSVNPYFIDVGILYHPCVLQTKDTSIVVVIYYMTL